ncbi:MAG: FadR/GntR family transcriptional regulator [Stappiaceae bacterium]
MNETSTIRFQSIKKPNVVGMIVESLQDALIRGDLKPGARLPSEQELGLQMGVGRSAVREALKVMEALGVIIIRPGAGTYVADGPTANMLGPLIHALVLSSGSSDELFELRFSVQLGYFVMAARNAGPEDFVKIRAAASALEKELGNEPITMEKLVELDMAFHVAVLHATHNPLIERVGRTVEELFFASFGPTMELSHQPGSAVRDHRDLIAALEQSDTGRLHEITARILKGWRRNKKSDEGTPRS